MIIANSLISRITIVVCVFACKIVPFNKLIHCGNEAHTTHDEAHTNTEIQRYIYTSIHGIPIINSNEHHKEDEYRNLRNNYILYNVFHDNSHILLFQYKYEFSSLNTSINLCGTRE